MEIKEKGFTTICRTSLLSDDELNTAYSCGARLVGFTYDREMYVYIFLRTNDVTCSAEGVSQVKEDNKPARFMFKQALRKLGVNEQTANDWIKVRQAKRAAQTETAFNIVKREVSAVMENYGVSADDVVRVAIDRNWQGIKAQWYDNIDWNYYGVTVGLNDLPFGKQEWE